MILKMNEVTGKGLMEEALVGIKTRVPFVKDARIQTIAESGGYFVTTIEVFLKRQKSIIATKAAESPRLSISKALDAVLKQLSKIKTKNKRIGRKRIDLRQVVATEDLASL